MRRSIPILASAVLVAAACAREPGRTVSRSSTTHTDAEGRTQKTDVETIQVGSTLEQKAETRTADGSKSVRDVVETYIGTVTAYTPGKRIEVMTGDKKTHSVALDDKKQVVDVDSRIAVGSRVKLVEETTSDGHGRRVTVRTAA